MKFRDRWEAGVKLADALGRYKAEEPVVLALPRGGVVPAAAVAGALRTPLDVVMSRKIGHPWAPEYAIGAVSESGAPVWNRSELTLAREEAQLERAAELQRTARRLHLEYTGRRPLPLTGRTAILVDDGLATGLTMAAAAGEVRRRGAGKVVVSVPVAPRSARSELNGFADEVVVLLEPESGFQSVGQYYEVFEQVTGELVAKIVSERQAHEPAPVNVPAIGDFIQGVEHYPVTSGELARSASERHAPRSVVQFFESIPSDVTFDSREDVITRTTEAGLLMEQERTEPPERDIPGD
jgi:predicted phosphoribosyltransferase